MAEQQEAQDGRKRKALVIFGIILSVCLVAGYLYYSYRRTHVSTDDAFVEGNIHTIAARIAGAVRSVSVRDNQPVKTGDVLVELDPADHRARAAAARANLDVQRANLRLAEIERKRAEALFQNEAGSAERRDRAVASFEMAQAQAKLAEEQLRQAELDLGYTVITAPADGQVTRKVVQTGNRVSAGQPLMAVVSLGEVWVVANFKETQLADIRPGQRAEITVDSYPGRTFSGTVDSIMAGTGVSFSLFPAENATGNYVKVVQRVPVKIRLDKGADRDPLLRVGMSVVPTVITK